MFMPAATNKAESSIHHQLNSATLSESSHLVCMEETEADNTARPLLKKCAPALNQIDLLQ